MKPIRLLPFFFFLINALFGIALGSSFSLCQAESTPGRAMPTLANAQRTILLLVVDRLKPEAKLVAAWTLIYAPELRSPAWIPLYPALPSSDPAYAEELFQSFSLTQDIQPDPAFLDTLRQHNLAWSGYIVLDGDAILETMKFFDIPTRPRNLTDWLMLSSTRPQGHDAALRNQIVLLDSICTSAAAQPNPFDLLKLYPRLRKHLKSDLDLRLAFSEWKQFFYPGADLQCQFPPITQVP
jgi:hypothetical protein